MRRCISLCVALVTLLVACSSLVSAGGWEDDEVFIVSCCATGEIPMNSEPESACTQAFCDKVTNNQAAAFKEFEKKIEKDENEATKDGFVESHRKGEGREMKDLYLKELKGKTNIKPKIPKYTGSLVKPPSRKASLLELQGSFMARQAKLLRRINSATSSATANTYIAGNLHPQGRIKFKWTGNLAGPITPMSAPVKTVLFWYVNAMKQWEKNTCIWFEESDAATVSFTDSQHGSSSNGLGTASTLVKVEQPMHGTARTRACAEHELGHTIGFDHTNKRTDAFHNPADAVNDFITFDTNTCVNDFWGYCDTTPAELADNFVQAYCADNSQAAQVGAWADQYLGHAGVVYDFATPGHKDYCERLVCVVGWIYQYEQSATLTDTGAYEYGSIMHYPFDNCIKKNAAKNDAFGNKAPGKNKVTDNDRALLNNVYGCIDLTVNWATTKPAKTVKVHPKLPASDLKAYLSKKLGWNDAFTLKKTADSAPVTGNNPIGNLGAVDLVPKFQI